MNDNWIAQAVRAHVLDGSSQSELTRTDIERCQRETVRRLEACVSRCGTERPQRGTPGH
jgi:hypothetical protein